MEISNKLKREAKQAKLEWDVYVMANLVAMGFSQKDAYASVINKNSTASESYDIMMMKRITEDVNFVSYVERRKKQLDRKARESEEEKLQQDMEEGSLMDKETVAWELMKLSKSTSLTPKERGEILMKYADLLQMKKDEVKEEEKLIHFYLPLSCDRCSLYLDAKKNNRRVVKD